jgi:uncharacterized membrane-anchored protein YjiN (DUF445 family)
VAVALVIVVVLTDEDAGWAGYVTAFLEAALVGGFADWFAVTALFRRPAGLPIPHTAVIPERKDSFGETLGSFVQEELLTADAVVERVRNAQVAARAGAWLADPANAARTARHMADAAVTLVDLLEDDEVHNALDEALRERIGATPLAPFAGRTLNLLTAEGRHHAAFDALLRGLDRVLRENRAELRARFLRDSPWWLPGAVEDRVFERLMDGTHRLLHDVASDPEHELRRTFDQKVQEFAAKLQMSPELLAKGEALKQELLDQPELRQWIASVWRDLKATLRAQASDAESTLRRRLTDTVAGFGTRLGTDETIATKVDNTVEDGARYLSEQFHDEIASMVTNSIAGWDGHQAASRLELLLGPDLQFIRINGTVVGGLAGLVIYSVTQLLG